ncbi:hypothetical protein KO507_14580 [Gilvimarinus agarilyticus]|uniref:hypothetical protein n=1 Tax=unclassified Gilvimarinus TaxID=2642066 RepID=UPI001C0801DB|nr:MULTISPECIES: hypothetical protein [unclassified Gilvimarinus]MBU2886993.1 hypothetical protein [Gilvimarinus agarilyticus]MDO6571653.1 hypothetical protein [Gilvimarinus sp. 2_MG-2023]MDO6745725.1 hypothetical protein [Gilvimarinus sp. 1_MG-2023]
MRNLLTFVLFLVVAIEAGLLYLGHQRQLELQADLVEQQKAITALQVKVDQQAQTLGALEDETVGAMVQKANAVIVGGWDAIANSVEAELDKARQALEQLNEQSND